MASVLGFVVAVAGALGMGTGLISPATQLIGNSSIALEISTHDVGPLYPGATQRLNLVISNPADHTVTLEILSVTINDATTRGGVPVPGCNGPANYVVAQNLVPPAGAVVVAAHATSSLSDLGVPEADWPAIQMVNLPSNQDACQGAALSLSYAGTAGSVA